MLDLFDLPRGVGEEGKKESKVARIMAFMAAPKASGKKDMKAAADAKREKAAEKRERLAAKKTKLAEKKDKAKAKKEREQAKKDKERAKKGGGKGAKALPTDAEAIKAELQAMAARQAKLLAKLEKAVEEPASAKSGRAAAPRGDAEAPPAKRAKATAAEGSAPDAATAEKQSKMPADDALREAIAELLKDGDQESLSLKKMRADLVARFGVPQNEKKAKIKESVEAIVVGEPDATRPSHRPTSALESDDRAIDAEE